MWKEGTIQHSLVWTEENNEKRNKYRRYLGRIRNNNLLNVNPTLTIFQSRYWEFGFII